MRPVPISSATFYSILWISASAIVGVATQNSEESNSPSFGSLPAMVTSTSSDPTVTSATETPDYYGECAVVYGVAAAACISFCRIEGVEAAATNPTLGCTRTSINDFGNITTTVHYPDSANLPTSTVVTAVSGNPLYVSLGTGHFGVDTTIVHTRTRFVTPTPTPTTTTLNDIKPSGASTSGASTSGASGAANSSNALLNNANNANSGGGSNAGAIAGGVVGGILGLLLIVAAIFFLRRRRRNAAKPHDAFSSLEKSRGETSPHSMAPQIPVTSYDSPPPPPQQQPHPESQHSLMGTYSPTGGVAHGKHPTEVEVDEDGVSLRSPSPPLGEETSRGRDYVPRLPIYHRGSDETPRGSAL